MKTQTSQSSSAIIHSCPLKKVSHTGWLMNTQSGCKYLWRLEVYRQGWCFCICWGGICSFSQYFWLCLHTVERVRSSFLGLFYEDRNAICEGSFMMTSLPLNGIASMYCHLVSQDFLVYIRRCTDVLADFDPWLWSPASAPSRPSV